MDQVATGLSASDEALLPGARYALEACALAYGPTRGPTLLLSAMPAWEHVLRLEIGDQLFTRRDPDRPRAQAWAGAVWLEPQQRSWRQELRTLVEVLPHGGLLSIVLSLPLAVFQRKRSSDALGTQSMGVLRLRAALKGQGFKIERVFGFQTIWSSLLRRIALRLQPYRPDWSDRLRYATRRSFATRRYTIPFAAIGLIEARAGMRP